MALTAKIAAAASGDNVIVTGVTNKRIRVLGFVLSFSGTVNAKWRSNTTDLTGLEYGAVSKSDVAPVTPSVIASGIGWFATNQGEDLRLNLSAATAVGGFVVYDLVS